MKSDVFTIGHAKDAALLYEGVLCVVPDEVWTDDHVFQRKILENLAPARIKEPFRAYLDAYFSNKPLSKLRDLIKDSSNSTLWDLISPFLDESLYKIFDDIKKIYVQGQDVGLDAFVKPQSLLKGDSPSLVLTLQDIDLIDTSNTSWEAILALRENPEAIERIRRFRRYLLSFGLEQKTANQVREELLQILDEYKTTAKTYDLILENGSHQVVLPKGGTFAGGIVSLVGILMGEPTTWVAFCASVASTGAGYFFDLRHGKLELNAKAIEYNSVLAKNPIVHLMSVEKIGALKGDNYDGSPHLVKDVGSELRVRWPKAPS